MIILQLKKDTLNVNIKSNGNIEVYLNYSYYYYSFQKMAVFYYNIMSVKIKFLSFPSKCFIKNISIVLKSLLPF